MQEKVYKNSSFIKIKDASDKFSRNLKYGELRKVQVI